MRKFVIERNIPGIGDADRKDMREAARTSNAALARLSPRIQWQHSYVCGEKTFCIYLAEDEAVIREHAEISGFPADSITEVKRIIDPTTASAVSRLRS